jgi:hypothetical protein
MNDTLIVRTLCDGSRNVHDRRNPILTLFPIIGSAAISSSLAKLILIVKCS